MEIILILVVIVFFSSILIITFDNSGKPKDIPMSPLVTLDMLENREVLTDESKNEATK